jgi:Na+/melibiose symporter-like transporter
MKEQKKMHWYDFISINLFWLGLNIRNNAVQNIFMPYMVAIFVAEGTRNTALGMMRTAGLIIAMLVQPAMGLLSDRSTSRFGRRRPFIFVGVILDLIFLAFIALSWDYASLLTAVLLIQFSSNISHGPLQALIPDQVPEEHRGLASAVKAIFELLPLILLAFTIAKLVGNGQFQLAVFATGASLLVIMLLTMILVKEEPLKEKPLDPLGPPMVRVLGVLAGIVLGALAGLASGAVVGGVVGLIARLFTRTPAALAIAVALGGMIWMVVAVVIGVWSGALIALVGPQKVIQISRDGFHNLFSKDKVKTEEAVKENSSFTWWVVNRLMFLAAITSIQGFAPYFLMYAFKITNEAAAEMTGNLIMIVGVFTLLSAIPSGWLSDKFGHKRLVELSGVLAAVGGFLLLGTIWLPNITLILVAGCILGLATGLFMTTNWALGTDVVPSAEAGRYLGISNLAGAGAGMIGSGIGGPVADYLNGFLPGLGYFSIFASYGVLFLLSIFSLHWVKLIDKTK